MDTEHPNQRDQQEDNQPSLDEKTVKEETIDGEPKVKEASAQLESSVNESTEQKISTLAQLDDNNNHNNIEEEEEEQKVQEKDMQEKSNSEEGMKGLDQQNDKEEDDDADYDDMDIDEEEERKDNQSTQNSINQEGPSIKAIPSLFPNTNIMHIRDQNHNNELVKPFEELNELIQSLKQKQKYQKWYAQFQDIIEQLNHAKQNLIDLQQPTQDRTLRESQLDFILEQITIIRSQFDEVIFETANLSDEGGNDKKSLTEIDELLNKITQLILKYQNQRISQITSFLANNNSRSSNAPADQNSQHPNRANNLPNANEVQNNAQNNNGNNQVPNNNNNNANINNQNANNNNNNQRPNAAGQDVQVVRTYSMSLDLQIFQSIIDGFQQLVNHFDLVLKGMISFTSIFMAFSIYQILTSVLTNSCEDPFVQLMKWMISTSSSSGGYYSKVFVLNGIIQISFLIILFWRQIWKYLVGPFTVEQRARVKENLFRFCIFKHLIIIKILDERIWTCHFDVLVLCVIYMQADVSRFFTDIIETTIKNLLNSMSEDYDQEIKKIQTLKKFNTILAIYNFITISLCMVVFQSVPRLILLRLLYGIGIAFFWNIRIQMMCNKLVNQNGIQYYVNFNSDIILEPTLSIEQQTNLIFYSLKLSYLFYLGILYFEHASIQIFQSFFILYYFIFNVPSTLRRVAEVIQSYKNTSFFQKNIDEIFPKLEINENNKDDFCTICHDQLLVGRKLKDCSHAFHLKCLFQWIKTQPQPRCPNCRVEIRNARQISTAFNPQQQNAQNNNANQGFNIGGQFTFQQVNINGNLGGNPFANAQP